MKNDGLIINEINNESIIRKGLKNKLVTAEFLFLKLNILLFLILSFWLH